MIFILEVMYPSNMRITSRFQMRSASSKLFSNWHSIIKCILSDSIEWKLIILGSQESNNSSPISTKVIDYEIPFQWLKRRINERRVQNKRSTSRVLITVPKKKKRKLSENSTLTTAACTLITDIYPLWIISPRRGIAWIACTIIVIVNYTGWRTALIWGSELDFRVIRHVGSWI